MSTAMSIASKKIVRSVWLAAWCSAFIVLSFLYIQDRAYAFPAEIQQTLIAWHVLSPQSVAQHSQSLQEINNGHTLTTEQVVESVAEARLKAGLAPVTLDPRLSAVAQAVLLSSTESSEVAFQNTLTQALADFQIPATVRVSSLKLQDSALSKASLQNTVEFAKLALTPEATLLGVGRLSATKNGLPVDQLLLLTSSELDDTQSAEQTSTGSVSAIDTSSNQTTQPTSSVVFPEISDASILEELNQYRSDHTVAQLVENQLLCQYAQKRVGDLVAYGGLDNHEGFKRDTADLTNLPDALQQYSGGVIGENLAYQHCRNMTTGDSFIASTPQQLIEWCFDSSTKGHREAQLNPNFTAACIRHSQGYFVVIFGE